MVECMPIYGGGLGVLSGDHLKAASDLAVPLVGVGLLYQKGYLQQSLNPDGWQQERNPVNDFYTLPVRPVRDEEGQDLTVEVKLPTGRGVHQGLAPGRRAREAVPAGHQHSPRTSAPNTVKSPTSLYGGDTLMRIRQEIVLGIGGLRALEPARSEAHRLSHERGPLGVSGD